MKRPPPGRYETTTTAGEQVRAFVPIPLPPRPPLDLGALAPGLEAASLALGQLSPLVQILPDTSFLVYSYVRQEAVLSSRIEGTQSSLSDLLQYELGFAPGVPAADVTEVSRYAAALEHGLARLGNGFPLSNRLLRELHGILLASGRGSGQTQGEFRRSQNWIGGTRPGTAAFVPPPHVLVPDCMAALERFLHAREDGIPVLLRAGLAHVQFETIHPFLDGNGRVGRLLIVLLLHDVGVLREPLLYLSVYLKRHRETYHDLLDRVRREGDWEAWLTFFLEGVRQTAESAVLTARRLTRQFEVDRARLAGLGRRSGSALRVHDVFRQRPLLTVREASRRTGLSFTASQSAVRALEEIGAVQEVTGYERNRVYCYGAYLRILNEAAGEV